MRGWILGLAGTALLTCGAMALTPEGRAKRVVRLVCGFAMVLALLAPLGRFDPGRLAGELAALRSRAREQTGALEEADRDISKTLIREECEAYIMDKATALGLAPREVTVSLRWSGEGYWFPTGAVIDCPGGRSEALTRVLSADLGLTEDQVEWRDGGDG